jgi:hypothetical protein
MGNPSNGWTPERRKRQAQLIHNWKPWERSTGPTSHEGKCASSLNAYKGDAIQEFRQCFKALKDAMREQREFVEQI